MAVGAKDLTLARLLSVATQDSEIDLAELIAATGDCFDGCLGPIAWKDRRHKGAVYGNIARSLASLCYTGPLSLRTSDKILYEHFQAEGAWRLRRLAS